ncbi:MAG: hypothetical protein HQK91_05810 [Nitrospirae bacterium]|nr:hypothetical protein [Nitrospirota bacterium]
MIKKVSLIIISFLIGIFIFFPYEKFYNALLDSLIKKHNIPVTFKIKSATPLKINLSSVSIYFNNDQLELNDVLLSVNPLKYLLNGSMALITTNNIKLNIIKEDNLFKLYFNINDFSNKFFDDTIIFINGSAYFNKIIAEEKKIQLNINDLKLIISNRNIVLNNVKGNFLIKNNIITIEKLNISGMVHLSIDGRIIINADDLQNSSLEIQVQNNNLDRNQMKITLKDTVDLLKNGSVGS